MAIFKLRDAFPDRVYIELVPDYDPVVYMDNPENRLSARKNITNYCSRIVLEPGNIATAYFYREERAGYPAEIPVPIASISGTWMKGKNNDRENQIRNISFERAKHIGNSNLPGRMDGDMSIADPWCSLEGYKS